MELVRQDYCKPNFPGGFGRKNKNYDCKPNFPEEIDEKIKITMWITLTK